jgi:hypothetical protein
MGKLWWCLPLLQLLLDGAFAEAVGGLFFV